MPLLWYHQIKPAFGLSHLRHCMHFGWMSATWESNHGPKGPKQRASIFKSPLSHIEEFSSIRRQGTILINFSMSFHKFHLVTWLHQPVREDLLEDIQTQQIFEHVLYENGMIWKIMFICRPRTQLLGSRKTIWRDVGPIAWREMGGRWLEEGIRQIQRIVAVTIFTFNCIFLFCLFNAQSIWDLSKFNAYSNLVVKAQNMDDIDLQRMRSSSENTSLTIERQDFILLNNIRLCDYIFFNFTTTFYHQAQLVSLAECRMHLLKRWILSYKP
jgi:hypothetical protein